LNLSEVTPLVLTYNEEANIGRTLDRLSWAERVVVVDSYSDDATLEIAKGFRNVDVVQRTFDTHSNQWNYGLERVSTRWVLALDADYMVSEALVREIERLEHSPEPAGYSASFVYCINGRPLRGTLYPPRPVLFQREKGVFVQDGHTQRLQLDGPVRRLEAPIYHDDRKSISRWLHAQHEYALLRADKLSSRSREELSWKERISRKFCWFPLLTLVYCLFAKGLILDGRAGWYYSLQRTYADLLLSLKLLDRKLR
jgi:glycosyltransferase involved in cell wall biosynthesis